MPRILWLVLMTLSVATAAMAEPKKVTLALNWVPEPEFGGIYAAELIGAYVKENLQVEIKPGGAGAPTWQRVATGQADFAVASADEVMIARSNGADVVAIFTIYQTCPQGIMVHAERGLKSIEDVFKSGTLALEIGLPYGKYLEKKYGFAGVKRIPYSGGVANFLADKNFAQQCFVFSEPIAAKQNGANPQTFLIADSGYNPYTGVIIVSGEKLRNEPETVAAMVRAQRAGWRAYLDDPAPANKVMGPLNPQMSAETFAAGAEAQKLLIEPATEPRRELGLMELARWEELGRQLVDIGILKSAPAAGECFANPVDGGR